MPEQPVERKLAAILVADIADYSRLVGLDEEGTLVRLRALRRELIDPTIAEHRGRIFKTTATEQLGLPYATLVNALSDHLPRTVERRVARVIALGRRVRSHRSKRHLIQEAQPQDEKQDDRSRHCSCLVGHPLIVAPFSILARRACA